MKKAIVLVAVIAGVVLTGAAWACEDGPECQDPYPANKAVSELRSGASSSPEIARAEPLHSDAESEPAHAEAPALHAHP